MVQKTDNIENFISISILDTGLIIGKQETSPSEDDSQFTGWRAVVASVPENGQ